MSGDPHLQSSDAPLIGGSARLVPWLDHACWIVWEAEQLD